VPTVTQAKLQLPRQYAVGESLALILHPVLAMFGTIDVLATGSIAHFIATGPIFG
jgi:hypothetical protein